MYCTLNVLFTVHFSCTTKLSIKFQVLIKTKMLKIKTFLVCKLSGVVFNVLTNVKKSNKLLEFSHL